MEAKLEVKQAKVEVHKTLRNFGPVPVEAKGEHICNLCNEHIWSFICSDCLAEDVESLLLWESSENFVEFHEEVKSAFHTDQVGYMKCVHCKDWKPAPICMYCYVGEVYHWLKGRHPEIAERVAKMLPVQEGSEFSELHGVRLKSLLKDTRPLTEGDQLLERTEFGICDDCGEYSDELLSRDSGWVCRACE